MLPIRDCTIIGLQPRTYYLGGTGGIRAVQTLPSASQTGLQNLGGGIINMADLLPEALTGVAAATDDSNNKRKKLQIMSPLAWDVCFTIYMGVVAVRHPECLPDMLAYAATTVHWLYQVNPWQVYDTQFHQQAAASKTVTWAQINTSIWTMEYTTKIPL